MICSLFIGKKSAKKFIPTPALYPSSKNTDSDYYPMSISYLDDHFVEKSIIVKCLLELFRLGGGPVTFCGANEIFFFSKSIQIH